MPGNSRNCQAFFLLPVKATMQINFSRFLKLVRLKKEKPPKPDLEVRSIKKKWTKSTAAGQ
jgi:hypothetical protein